MGEALNWKKMIKAMKKELEGGLGNPPMLHGHKVQYLVDFPLYGGGVHVLELPVQNFEEIADQILVTQKEIKTFSKMVGKTLAQGYIETLGWYHYCMMMGQDISLKEINAYFEDACDTKWEEMMDDIYNDRDREL